ncbi:MAG: hypothetical protein IRY91_02505 [Gemmatimonadaceae bacterium]|nr:hypothetical protein [Gemmatimonadaceae bacterium]
MRVQPYFTIESHPRSATLYLHGAVSVSGVLEAIRQCERLPESVWLLRVELSTAKPLDSGTFTVLAHGLRRWRETRSGITDITTTRRDPADPFRAARPGVRATIRALLERRDRIVAGS